MKYSQITYEQRIEIGGLLKAGLSKSCVAKQVGVHRPPFTGKLKEIRRALATTLV